MHKRTRDAATPQSAQRRTLIKAGAAAAGLAAAGATGLVRAQAAPAGAWPVKPVRVIVPFSPGGTADILGRIASLQLGKQLGQSFVVENKPGAGAAADGYTLLVITPTFSITQFVYRNLPYDGQRDFIPVGLLMTTPLVLVVNPALNVRNATEYIAAAKAKPGKITFSSSGSGSTPHLAFELLKQQAGIDLLHIPYKGGGEAVTAVLSGTVDSYFAAPIEINAYVKAGKLIAAGSTALTRTPGLADLPTLAESGAPGFEVIHYTAVLVRAGTPPEIVARLSEQLVRALQNPDVREKIAQNGDVPAGTLAEATELFKREHPRRAQAVKAANVKPD